MIHITLSRQDEHLLDVVWRVVSANRLPRIQAYTYWTNAEGNEYALINGYLMPLEETTLLDISKEKQKLESLVIVSAEGSGEAQYYHAHERFDSQRTALLVWRWRPSPRPRWRR